MENSTLGLYAERKKKFKKFIPVIMKSLSYVQYFLTGLTLMTLFTSTAYGDYQKGILLLNSGDSVECMIKVYKNDIFISSNKITIKENNKKTKITSGKVCKILFDSIIYEKLIIDENNQVQKGPGMNVDTFFARLLNDGNTKLYVRYKKYKNVLPPVNPSIPTAYGTVLNEDYFLVRHNSIKHINDLNFRNACLSFFNDCPEIIEKINTKEYRYNDIEDLVKSVNEACY